MKYLAHISNKTYQIEVKPNKNGFIASIDGMQLSFEHIHNNGLNTYSFFLNNRSYELDITTNHNNYTIQHDGKMYHCRVEDEKSLLLKKVLGHKSHSNTEINILAPMPGLVTAVEVTVGQNVKSGSGLVKIEAMKMENEIKAPSDCLVKKILVESKQKVEQDQVLLILHNQ